MNEGLTQEPSKLEDLYLPDFQKNNPQCKFRMDEGKFNIENAWSVSDVRFVFKTDEVELLKDVNNIAFRPLFDAIFHVDTNEVEFFFTYLDPDREPMKSYIDRSFKLTFLGDTFQCCFRKPSSRLFGLAKRLRRLPTSSRDPIAAQLRAFKDAQRVDELPEIAKKFFTSRVPRSFFVTTEKPLLDYDWEQLARHINFHMKYYDRCTPIINIRQKEGTEETDECGKLSLLRFLADSFPEAMAIHEIDEFILQLMEVADYSSPRFALIYYYQIIEYAGFYFVDEKAKKEIRRFLTDPAMVMCPDDRVSELLTVLSDLQHKSDAKMCRVIEDYCDPRSVWLEVENNKDFFSNIVEFEGGFQLPALISNDTTVDTWQTMWMPITFQQLTKIRNCLVHGRERRQGHVILPTLANTRLIARYVPLIQRIAEQIALAKVL